jgi:hypothetical protein
MAAWPPGRPDDRRRSLAFPRSQAYREPLRRGQRRKPQGPDGPNGRDSERAAIIYQHEAQGADLAITSAIDARIEAAKPGLREATGRSPGTPLGSANGPRRPARRERRGGLRWTHPLTCDFVERVTGIELALSAWESNRSGPLTILTWALNAPLVTVMNPATPGLMARQWPVALSFRATAGSRDASAPEFPFEICPGPHWSRLI